MGIGYRIVAIVIAISYCISIVTDKSMNFDFWIAMGLFYIAAEIYDGFNKMSGNKS